MPLISLLVRQFPVENLPYRSNCDSKGGGILLYFREDTPSNLFNYRKETETGFLYSFFVSDLTSDLFCKKVNISY